MNPPAAVRKIEMASPESAAVAPPVPANDAGPAPPKQASLLSHARYVIGENPVTGIAFGLFLLIAACAIFGPWIAPYDPLASNTMSALQPPS